MPFSIEARRILDKHHYDIIQNAMCGIALVDKEFRFVYANKRFLEMLEYSASEILGKTFSEFTLPSDVEADEKMAKAILEGSIEDYRMVKKYISKTGKLVQVVLVVRSYRDDSQVFEIFVPQVLQLENPLVLAELRELRDQVKHQDQTIGKLSETLYAQTTFVNKTLEFLKLHWWKIGLAILLIAALITKSESADKIITALIP